MAPLAPETVTHARLRAQQGDRAGAVRILQAVLARRPGDPEARALLADLPRGPAREAEPEEPAAPPPAGAAAADLASSFRRALSGEKPQETARERLTRFLTAVRRHAR